MNIHTHLPASRHALSLGCALLLGSMVCAQANADFEFDDVENVPQGVKYDAKTYPGITCEAQSVAEIGLFQNLGFMMVNANQGRRSVVCPVVRDNTENTDGTWGAFVHISNPPNRSTDCTLYSYDQYNVLIDSDTGSTGAVGNQTIFLDVDASVDGGFYGITCELPNQGLVHSYEVREFLDTDNEGGIVIGPWNPPLP